MTHREIRDDERCAKNSFLGVHVWYFAVKSRNRYGAMEKFIDGVTCKACGGYPPADVLKELVAKFETSLPTTVLADHLVTSSNPQAVK